ncbi:hypothetical protein FKM82_003232 [Ascaphus truei]
MHCKYLRQYMPLFLVTAHAERMAYSALSIGIYKHTDKQHKLSVGAVYINKINVEVPVKNSSLQLHFFITCNMSEYDVALRMCAKKCSYRLEFLLHVI